MSPIRMCTDLDVGTLAIFVFFESMRCRTSVFTQASFACKTPPELIGTYRAVFVANDAALSVLRKEGHDLKQFYKDGTIEFNKEGLVSTKSEVNGVKVWVEDTKGKKVEVVSREAPAKGIKRGRAKEEEATKAPAAPKRTRASARTAAKASSAATATPAAPASEPAASDSVDTTAKTTKKTFLSSASQPPSPPLLRSLEAFSVSPWKTSPTSTFTPSKPPTAMSPRANPPAKKSTSSFSTSANKASTMLLNT